MSAVDVIIRILVLIGALGGSALTQGAGAPPGMSFDTWQYGLDPVGNVTSRGTAADSVTFGYDELDRLIQETAPANNTAYSYDALGNREGVTHNNVFTDYLNAASGNRLDQVGLETRVHDAMGNTLSDRSGTRSFVYNDAGRLAQVREHGVLLATYTYNALGQRVSKVTPAGTTYYVYDFAGQLLGEYDANGQPVREYVHLNGEPLAQLDGEVTYLHTDHLGTPRRATDAIGEVVWTWESDAFGAVAADEDPDQNGTLVTVPLRFPGQYYDQETGLYYNWFRYYDPTSGRYITSDPVGLAGGLNTYLYALANPLRYTDPTGRFVFLGIPAWAWATGGAAAGAGIWWGFNNPSAVNSNVHVGPWPGSSEAGDPEEAGEDAADEIRDEDGICPPSDNQDRCRDVIKKCRQKCIDKSAPGARANTSEWIGRCVLTCTASMGCGNYIP